MHEEEIKLQPGGVNSHKGIQNWNKSRLGLLKLDGA